MTKLTWENAAEMIGNPNDFEYKAIAIQVNCHPAAPVQVFDAEDDEHLYDVDDKMSFVPKKGVVIYVDNDQETTAVFKDGEPVAAVVWSRRGRSYAAGLYIHAEGRHYACSNMMKPKNVWHKVDSPTPESEAAKDLLTGGK